MAILSFAMQKGGVGKTTTTLAVGVELAQIVVGCISLDKSRCFQSFLICN